MFTPLWLMIATGIYFLVAIKATIDFKRSTKYDSDFYFVMKLFIGLLVCYVLWPALFIIGPAYLIGTLIVKRS